MYVRRNFFCGDMLLLANINVLIRSLSAALIGIAFFLLITFLFKINIITIKIEIIREQINHEEKK